MQAQRTKALKQKGNKPVLGLVEAASSLCGATVSSLRVITVGLG